MMGYGMIACRVRGIMKLLRVFRFIGFMAICALCPSSFAQDAQTVFKKSLPSVMTLTVSIKGGGVATGTGFLSIREGVAVTALHVVADAESAVARFSDGQEYEVSGLIDKDEKRDIALVRVKVADRPMLDLVKLDPEIGSKAYVLGAPEGLDFSITDGIVSQVRTVNGVKLYQYSAPSNQGNSGGPVLNSNSEVLGVVSYGLKNTDGLNFAIASVNVRGLDSSLPTQPWVNVKSSPTPKAGRTLSKTYFSFAEAMNRLWSFATLMQVETEEVTRGKFRKLSPLFSEAEINLKVSSDILDSVLSSNTSNSWDDYHIGYFSEVIKMATLCGEKLDSCSQNRKSKNLESEVSKFVLAFRLTEVNPNQIVDLKSETGTNVVRLLGSLLTAKIIANPIQRGWFPGEPDRLSRKRFEGGFKLLARLAFDVDSTGYVFGFLADPTQSNRIYEVQGGTPPHSWGFQKGDIIQSVNGSKVSNLESMKQVILSTKNREGIVTVDRKGKLIKLKVNVKKWV